MPGTDWGSGPSWPTGSRALRTHISTLPDLGFDPRLGAVYRPLVNKALNLAFTDQLLQY
ncbi:hypothetical protein [Sinomonas gamaensis]|uniref:hypothetical protein n=1 Tax=Sinomonas gamaensis TaxID=2565624 RepID=UPI001486E173|nr:hypothetical protein [Sinomonas gamaensis]